MIIVLKKKRIFIAIVVILIVAILTSAGFVFYNVQKTASFNKKVIVIDAGHGGVDKGVVGKNGTVEAEKNLEISKKLSSLLSDAGFRVVMTRTTQDGLYGEATGDFKRRDFAERKRIIVSANPDMVVSVHCNKYPSSDRRGAQTFFNAMSDDGRTLAKIVQESLNALNVTNVGKAYSPLAGEYYMLNCSSAPSVIVECGFLSNAEDEKLLCDEKYVDDLVFSLYSAVVTYFDE